MQQHTVFERSGMWYLQYWRTEMRKNYLDLAFMGNPPDELDGGSPRMG